MTHALVLQHVHVALGRGRQRRPILNDVSLTIDAGQCLGLIGASGSGKSTTGRVALGLIRIDSGATTVGGHAYSRSRREHSGHVQAVLQTTLWAFNPRVKLGTSIAEPLLVTEPHLPRITRDTRVSGLLDSVGLPTDVADRYPHELSGGQRQRAAIARALITSPDFIVFDEAVSALDAIVQQRVLTLIKDLQRDRKFASLFITHDLAAASSVADTIAVMNSGMVVEENDTQTLLTHPRNQYTRRLLEAV